MITFSPEQKRRRNKIAGKLKRRDPRRPYTACVREAVEIVQGGKRAPKERAARAVGEAARRAVLEQAVGRAVEKALGQARAAQKPAARPIAELSEGELGAAFHSVLEGALRTPFMLAESAPAAAGDAPPAAQPPLPADTPLHKLDLETGDAVMGAGVGSYAQGYGLRSPFWRGA